jgi:hypothetical protein
MENPVEPGKRPVLAATCEACLAETATLSEGAEPEACSSLPAGNGSTRRQG